MPKFTDPPKNIAISTSYPLSISSSPPKEFPLRLITTSPTQQSSTNSQVSHLLTKKRSNDDMTEEDETNTIINEKNSYIKSKRVKKSSLNVKVILGITFEESVQGCCKKVEYQFLQACPSCLSRQSQEKCTMCHGSGKIQKAKNIDVEVPSNSKTGIKQILKGKGDVGEDSGLLGDLIIEYEVQDHPFFKRVGDDAICEVAISAYQAVLGSKIRIPKLYGEDNELLDITVNPGTQPNETIKIPQLGFRKTYCKKKRGELQITFKVEIPKQLTNEQKGLFEKLTVIESLTNLSNRIVDTCTSK